MSARGKGEGGGDAPSRAAVTRRIAEAWSAMDGIRVDYGPQDDAVEGLMQALHGALARPPGAACGVVTLIAPRGVGKSATLAGEVAGAVLAICNARQRARRTG